ncbi:hypothetical protein, partial [Klebsiella pneumoniae]|uniref:hypothetical protein n=1 Tax=Klebsiella pneumoniae TaxID=573 RepID=UPI0039C26828
DSTFARNARIPTSRNRQASAARVEFGTSIDMVAGCICVMVFPSGTVAALESSPKFHKPFVT